MHLLIPVWSGQCTFLGGVPPASEKLPDVPTFLHVKEQLQGAQVPDMDPVDSTAHRLPTEVRVLPACCVIAAEARPTSPPPPTEEASGARHGAGTEWTGGSISM